jgi:hypothetical protein
MDDLSGRRVANAGASRAAALPDVIPQRLQNGQAALPFCTARIPSVQRERSASYASSPTGMSVRIQRPTTAGPGRSPIQASAGTPSSHAHEQKGEHAAGASVGAVPSLCRLV